MLIEIKKEHVINSEVENVWSFLTNLKEVTSCIPGLQNLQIETPTKFRGKIKPQFSFVKGKFNIESEVKVFREKEILTIAVRGSSIGASFEITMDITLSAIAGTKIQTDVRLETFGLLKALPRSLIHQVVEDIATPMLSCIKEKLE
ncbi:MAG: CoxG family protein [Nitrososphaerales archaeon]